MFEVQSLKILQLPLISFSLKAGEAMAVVGPSGSGKSLLLRALADLDPYSGRISFNGRECQQMPAPEWRRFVRYVSAEPGWWADTPRMHFQSDSQPGQPSLTESLRSLQLPEDILDRPIQQLSTGERIRLALLRALEDHPRVLLLDEPTGALDVASTQSVELIIQTFLQTGGYLVLVTHDKGQAGRLAAQILDLQNL